jgi:hypothetical protein
VVWGRGTVPCSSTCDACWRWLVRRGRSTFARRRWLQIRSWCSGATASPEAATASTSSATDVSCVSFAFLHGLATDGLPSLLYTADCAAVARSEDGLPGVGADASTARLRLLLAVALGIIATVVDSFSSALVIWCGEQCADMTLRGLL